MKRPVLMQKTAGLWRWPLVSAKRYILQVLTSGPWNIAWQINIHFQSFHKQLAAVLIVLWYKPEFFCVFPPSPSFLLLTYLQALGLCCFGQQICRDPKASQGTENIDFVGILAKWQCYLAINLSLPWQLYMGFTVHIDFLPLLLSDRLWHVCH